MIKNGAKSTEGITSPMLRLSTICWRYQIRAKCVGRLRLITSQARWENRFVLQEWVTALAVEVVVIEVFNFCLGG